MLYLKNARFLAPLLAVVLLTPFFWVRPAEVAARERADEGVRADLPLGGEIAVINPRGSVRIEVWSEQHVSVSAAVKGEKPRRSPVNIQRTERLLTVSVSPTEVGMLTRVDLTLRLPERSRASVVCETGGVTVLGLPEELSVKSVYGDIRAEFSLRDADVRAEAPNGRVIYPAEARSLSTGTAAGDKAFSLRAGAGSKTARLRSDRGRVTLVPIQEAPVEPPATAIGEPSAAVSEPPATAVTERRKPVLVAPEQGRAGAGTPSTPLTGPEEVDEGDVVRVDTELVTLNVSVIDRGTNRGLKGLTENDFKLFEDGEQQQLAHFESASAPFNLVLLIDVSFSTQDKIGLIRQAALHFVESARPADRIGIVAFAKTPIVVSPLTDDREALRRRIAEGIQPRGSTKVYDSIAFAMDQVLKDSGPSRRNAIILMSDGLDSTMPNVGGEGSFMAYKDVLSRVREFDGVLYSLWVDTETEYSSLSALEVQPETFDLAHDQMEEFATAGGGVFYEVEELEDLAGAYERVVADLGTVYSLSYRPTNKVRDGKWRAIRVAVARPNAAARGKRGYYAN